jgi:uncharacterized Tic20 family protein
MADTENGAENIEKNIQLAFKLIAANSIILIISCAIVLFIIAPSLAAGVFEYLPDAPFYSTLIEFFPTVEELTWFMQLAAAAGIAAGAMAAATAALVRKRRLWKLTMALSFLSALGGIISGVGIFLGLIAFWKLRKTESAFKD